MTTIPPLGPEPQTAEERRLQLSERREQNWHRWGPYLSERQWGTVREDYSAGDGGDNPWSYFTHDDAPAARTAGVKTVCWGSATASAGCVLV